MTDRVDELERELENIKRNFVRSEVTNGVLRVAASELPTNTIAGRLRYVIDDGSLAIDQGDGTWRNAYDLPQYTVDNLPAGRLGQTALATNGRKSGETAGNGTGVPVWYDGSNWLTYYDNSTVQA